jgi:hypothetical protein
MWRLAVAVGVFAVATWLLLYVNAIETVPGTLWGHVAYFSLLILPSSTFWFLLWVHEKVPGGSASSLVAIGCLVFSVAAVGIGFGLMLLEPTSMQYARPLLSSFVSTTYVDGLVLFVAALIWIPLTKHWILHRNLSGTLAFGASITALLVFWIANSARTSTVSWSGSLFVDICFLGLLLLTFLSLLNSDRFQFALGLAALVSLGVILLRFGVFFSLWLTGSFFWAFVILCSLIVEAVLFRVIWRKLFRMLLSA